MSNAAGKRPSFEATLLRVAALVGALLPSILAAQAVRGVVVDHAEVPVPGVVLLLVDSNAAVVSRALSGERGAFRLPAARSGTYTIRTLRIGFRPVTSEPLRLDGDVTHRVVLTGVPISLETLRVSARSACRIRPDTAAETFVVWEQIRGALTAAQLTAGARGVDARIVGYSRTLDSRGRRVTQQSSFLRSGFVTEPWGSLSPDSLHRAGYVVSGADDSITYHAPSLEALLSRTFLADHCFRLVASRDPMQLELRFEPTPVRKQSAEIAGTIVLDRRSSELRSLTYRYVNIPARLAQDARGEMQFVRMQNGAWAISRWSIRMPQLALFRQTGFVVLETRVAAFQVAGGELALVVAGSDTVWSLPPLVLRGTIVDSTSGTGIGGARVALQGTQLQAVADHLGRFAIPGVLPGEYTLDVRTPSLDSLGAAHIRPLAFADTAAAITVRVPTPAQVAAVLCRDPSIAHRFSEQGFIAGAVEMPGDTARPRNLRVMAEWVQITIHPGHGSVRQRIRMDTRTDARGTFRLCGVPLDKTIVLRAATDGASVRTSVALTSTARFGTVDLVLDPERKPAASFVGTVLGDTVGTVVVGAEVSIPELLMNDFTDDRGQFTFAEVPAGEHQIVVRRLGYGPVDTRLTFTANRTLERAFHLSKVAVLDTVAVSESVVLPSFEEHRRLGLGAFLTRADLERKDGRLMSSILAELPGLSVMRPGTGNRAWVANGRAIRSMGNEAAVDEFGGAPRACYSQVYLDNVRIYTGRKADPPSAAEPLFDINSLAPSMIEAIEYYAGPAQTPLKYSNLDSHCGVLVIHTRRSP